VIVHNLPVTVGASIVPTDPRHHARDREDLMARARERTDEDAAAVSIHDNRVSVTGRVSAAATARTLPSGDEMVTWRLVVDRPPSRRSGPAFDVVDCVGWAARIRRSACAWSEGDVVMIDGALRRRFWRSPGGGLQSRCEVEVSAARRVAVAVAPVKRRRRPG
jgi:single-strand DNA-binding protein